MKINNKTIIFLRKKIEGQNSIEEIASTLAKNIPDTEIKVFPEHSNSIKGIIKNILFAIKNQGKVNHVISPSESYVGPFIRNSILTWHDVKTLFQSKSKWRRRFRKFINLYPTFFFDKITCISAFTKNEIKEYLPKLKDEKIIIIYNPYNSNFICSRKEGLSTPPIIFHPGTAKRKNLSRVIEALKELPVHLNIIGKLSEEQESLLKKYKIDYSNEYDVSIETMIQHYKECDILSFPTLYEGFGVPVIEAQATGRPVLTSKVGPIPEVAGDAAFFIDPEDVSSIRDGIIKLLENNDLRQGLVNKGLENVKRFTTENICRQYQVLYNSL